MMAHPLLLQAVLQGNLEALENLLLVTKGERRNPSSVLNDLLTDGRTPLNVAITAGNIEVAQRLLDLGADPDLPDSFRVDGLERRAIHCACAVGCVELVKDLVERFEIDPEDRDCGLSTPLHHAAQNGHLETVRYLLEELNCDVAAQSSSGRTALWKAAVNRHVTTLNLLFQSRDADVNIRNRVGESVLFECVRQEPFCSAVLRELLQRGADVSIRDIEGNQALHSAAMAGNVIAGEMLLDQGAELQCCNESGSTPLHSAITYGQVIFACFLLNHGADPRLTNRAGQTPFYLGLLHSRMDCLRLLFQSGYLSAGSDVQSLHKYSEHSDDTKRQCYQVACNLLCNPKSLSSCCRVVVRNSLHGNAPVKAVYELPIPQKLCEFLLLHDFTM